MLTCKIISKPTLFLLPSNKLLNKSKRMSLQRYGCSPSPQHCLSSSVQYCCSNSLPKGSQFSSFMGLQQQLQSVRKQEAKQQKSSILSNSIMTIVCFVFIGGFAFVAFYDKRYRFLLSLELIKLKTNLYTSLKQKPVILRQGLVSILQFLNATPYDYPAIVNQLNYLSKELRHIPSQQLLQLANQCYSLIAQRNFKSAQNAKLVEGSSNLVELMILNNQKVSEEVIKMLLRGGEIQQVYLALTYLQKNGKEHVDWISEQTFKAEVKQNLSSRKKKDDDYYAEVFSKREQDQYPQIAFRRAQENRWLRYIQTKLDISCQ